MTDDSRNPPTHDLLPPQTPRTTAPVPPMTDGNVEPWTVEPAAALIRTVLESGRIARVHVSDGRGTLIAATFVPARDLAHTRNAPPVHEAGFMVAVERLGAYWFQPSGYAAPDYVQSKLLPHDASWAHMAACLAALLTAVRCGKLRPADRDAIDAWLGARLLWTPGAIA